jgi:hypothetical protein
LQTHAKTRLYPVLERLRQKDLEFETSLDYIERSCHKTSKKKKRPNYNDLVNKAKEFELYSVEIRRNQKRNHV